VGRKKKSRVNYLSNHYDRQRMGYYLRVGSFKKIAGKPIIGRQVTRRRIMLAAIAAIILVVGLRYVFA
jgi:hypothetical protein